MIGSIFWRKKHDWQHILEKNIIDSTFWGKKHDSQHILGKTMIHSTLWKKYGSQHILREKT
jgi:hypothetical protein